MDNVKLFCQRNYHYLLPVLVGLGLRILWVIAVPVVPVSDSNAYDVLAQNLAKGNGFGWGVNELTAYWPPGTSFIYAVFYKIFGHSYWPIVIFNLLVAIGIIWVTMSLAEKWFDHRTAVLTGFILAFWPAQIQFTTVLASELIFTILLMTGLLVWLEEKFTLRSRAIGVGVIMAAACYVRPTALLIPFLLLFFRVIKTREIFKTVTATLVMFLIMAIIIAPWSYRNTQLFGHFTLLSTNGGAVLWMGNNPKSKGGYMPLPEETKEMNESQKNQYLKSIAKEHIKEEPLVFIQRCIIRLIDTHSRENISVAWNQKGLVSRYGSSILLPLKIVNQLYWLLALGLALIGIIILGKQYGWLNMIIHPTVVIWAYLAGVHVVIISNDRYHFPSVPMIAILAALTLKYGLDLKARFPQAQLPKRKLFL